MLTWTNISAGKGIGYWNGSFSWWRGRILVAMLGWVLLLLLLLLLRVLLLLLLLLGHHG